MKKVFAVAVKEVREIWRVRLFLVLAFGVPFVMFIVFGYGISLDVEHMPFAYIDQDHSQLSARLVEKFKGRYFELREELFDPAEADRLLTNGSLRAVLVIPPDFSRKIYRGDTADVQFLIDGGYPYRALTVKGYAEATMAAFNREIMEKKLIRSGYTGQLPQPIKAETRYFFNESLQSSYALIPGLIAIVLLMNPAVLTALAITREKEFGTIYNIYSSPIKKWEFLTGKIIPYLIISSINFTVIVLTVKFLFHIPMKGHIINLIPGAFIYMLINVSIGLLVSSVTRTMISAQIVTIIATVIPAFLYSGLLIPVANLEGEAKVVAHLYPTMHFMKIIHGVYLKNLGLLDLLPQMLLLMFYFAVLFSIGIMVFKKREG
ncbi:MAG: ABC transporter permease [Nitrospirota bacterium]|nr:ABC transporter permease [Nitrospirota bacterium]